MSTSRDKLICSAKKLDFYFGKENNYLDKVNNIIANHTDTKSVAELYKSIFLLQQANKRNKLTPLLKDLSDNLASFLGYTYLFDTLEKELGQQEKSSLNDLLAELNQLVGLERVKKEVSRLIIYQKVQSKRKESGLNIPKRTLHMAFWEIQEQEKQLLLELLEECTTNWDFYPKDIF